MSKLRFDITMSLDGFVAGRDQSEENGLGVGGEELHDWVIPLAAWREPHGLEGGEVNASTSVFEESLANGSPSSWPGRRRCAQSHGHRGVGPLRAAAVVG